MRLGSVIFSYFATTFTNITMQRPCSACILCLSKGSLTARDPCLLGGLSGQSFASQARGRLTRVVSAMADPAALVPARLGFSCQPPSAPTVFPVIARRTALRQSRSGRRQCCRPWIGTPQGRLAMTVRLRGGQGRWLLALPWSCRPRLTPIAAHRAVWHAGRGGRAAPSRPGNSRWWS